MEEVQCDKAGEETDNSGEYTRRQSCSTTRQETTRNIRTDPPAGLPYSAGWTVSSSLTPVCGKANFLRISVNSVGGGI
jgi:hypothetical protein